MPRAKKTNRSDGRYELKKTIGYDADGNAIRKSFYGKNKDEAQILYEEFRRNAEKKEAEKAAAATPAPEEKKAEEAPASAPAEPASPAPDGAAKVRGATTVSVSPIQRPGFAMSGSVSFGSGVTADWYVDQTGRLGLDNASGQPDEQDIQEFQIELRKALGM